MADTRRSGASRFGGVEGRQASHGGDSRKAFPWRQAKRAAPQARRREGLKPNGRDGAAGTGPSPKARRCEAPARHAVRATTVSTLEADRHEPRSSDDVAFMPCCESSTAPRRSGGALGGRQAAWGLLRDQISVCVPSSSSISRA